MSAALLYSQVGRQALTRDVKALVARGRHAAAAPAGRSFATLGAAPTRAVKFEDFTELPWANGKGSSYEILSDRRDGIWTYRVALAPVEADGAWSTLPGVDRALVVVTGAGFDLSVDNAGTTSTLACAPFDVVNLRGDATTTCALRDGSAWDLGVMTFRDCGHRALLSCHAMPDPEEDAALADLEDADGLTMTRAPSVDLPPADVIFATEPRTLVKKGKESHVLGKHGALLLNAEDRDKWTLKEGAVAVIRIDSAVADWGGDAWTNA